MSSVNKDSFTSSFPICVPLIFLSCFIALDMISSLMLNRCLENGHASPISQTQGEIIQSFTIEYDVNCKFFINALSGSGNCIYS